MWTHHNIARCGWHRPFCRFDPHTNTIIFWWKNIPVHVMNTLFAGSLEGTDSASNPTSPAYLMIAKKQRTNQLIIINAIDPNHQKTSHWMNPRYTYQYAELWMSNRGDCDSIRMRVKIGTVYASISNRFKMNNIHAVHIRCKTTKKIVWFRYLILYNSNDIHFDRQSITL